MSLKWSRYAFPHYFIRKIYFQVVHGNYTSGTAVATAFLACASMQKLPVLVGNCPSFVFNRLLAVYLHQVSQKWIVP